MILNAPELAGKTAYLTLPAAGEGAGFSDRLYYFTICADGAETAAEEMPLKAQSPRMMPYPVRVGADGTVTLSFFDGAGGDALPDPGFCSLIRLTAEPCGGDRLYREATRPLVHFSPARGYMNDPNGLTWYDGTYYLFFQLNPYGVNHGNTHWALARSTDLLHWTEEKTPVLAPDDTGMMWSGSGVVDYANTSGLGDGVTPPILLFYTATGMRFRPKFTFDADGKPAFPKSRRMATVRGAVSTDGGKTFRKLPGEPLVDTIEMMNRDPKVVWNGDAGCWVMMLYLKDNDFTLLYSDDLLRWERGQTFTMEGTAECPDLFALCLDDDPSKRKWVLFGSPENYMIGRFAGREFVPETPLIRGCMQTDGEIKTFTGAALYAPQTFSGLPDGRVVQLSWMPTIFPGESFQSQMSLPWELRLRSTPAGPRLSKLPAAECLALRGECVSFTREDLSGLGRTSFEALDLELKASFLREDGGFAVSVRGVLLVYDHGRRSLATPTGVYHLPFVPADGISLRVIADRGSLEVFTSDGLFNCGLNAVLDPSRKTVEPLELRDCTVEGTVWNLSL